VHRDADIGATARENARHPAACIGPRPFVYTVAASRPGKSLIEREKHVEAEPLLHECLEVPRDVLPEDHWPVFNELSVPGASFAGQQRPDEAEPLLLDSYEQLEGDPDAPSESVREALERIINPYEAWDKPDQAAE
jgi:hypothetical protein